MRRILWPLMAMLCGVGLAQTPLATFDGGALGYRLGYPSSWVLEQADDASYLNIQPPPGSPDFGRVGIEFLVHPEVTGTLEEGIEELLAELRANLLPDLTVLSHTHASVSGAPAVVVRLTGTVDQTHRVTYRLLIGLQGRIGYVLFLEALSEHLAAYEPLLDQVQASLTLTRAQETPISPIPSQPSAPDYAGTFANEQLRLTLEAQPFADAAYAGTLHHGEERYPVSAGRTPHGLAGDFESGGGRFAFTASLAGNELTFVTAGTSYVLVREAAVPDAPANPLSLAPPTGREAVAPSPSEIVASERGSAVIGDLAPNGRARGHLDGGHDTITDHTYVVEVPAGALRLTVVLDADVDLDIALKHGSDIRSFADKEHGGDWDYRDIGTQNPTTIVIEQPTPGRWYVDVINALGAPHGGTYRLGVSTAAGGF